MCERSSRDPGGEAVEIKGCGGSDVLQVSFGQTAVACPSQAKGTHGLRESAFYALALRVEALAVGRALSCPRRGKGVVLALRQEREHATLIARTRSGATLSRCASPAVGGTELGTDAGALAGLFGMFGPARALLALGAARNSLISIQDEVGKAECALDVVLPAQVPPARSNQIDAVLLPSGYEVVGTDLGGVHQVLRWGQALGGEGRVD